MGLNARGGDVLFRNLYFVVLQFRAVLGLNLYAPSCRLRIGGFRRSSPGYDRDGCDGVGVRRLAVLIRRRPFIHRIAY